MDIQLDEKDKEKVITEIADCQSRIMQTFVPTIIGVGLIAIADQEEFALITLFAAFSILFGTSLYIANLSYKIFRNASFLKVISENEKHDHDNMIHWENALSSFSKKVESPAIIGYETKTIAVVYMMFAIVYIFMFYSINAFLSIILGLILIAVGIKILKIPSRATEYYNAWNAVVREYSKKEQS